MRGTLSDCLKPLPCIDEICFENTYDAGKYLLLVASRRQRVSLSRRLDPARTCPLEGPR